jgi:hypothetical protein
MHVAAVWRSPVNSIYEPGSAGATATPAALAPARRRRSQAARIRPGSLSASALARCTASAPHSAYRTFVDTNVLVYAHDAQAGSRHITAKRILGELWDSRDGSLSTQVLQEFYAGRPASSTPLCPGAKPAAWLPPTASGAMSRPNPR